jgi:hypothetical protein
MMVIKPGETYYCGFAVIPMDPVFYDHDGVLFRNGEPAGVADFNPPPGMPPGNYIAIAGIPADWLPGDTVQVAVYYTNGTEVGTIWLPPVTLAGPVAAATYRT